MHGRRLSSETAASSSIPNRSVIAFSVYSRTQRENSICQGSPFQASALEETRRLYIETTAVAGLGIELGAWRVLPAVLSEFSRRRTDPIVQGPTKMSRNPR